MAIKQDVVAGTVHMSMATMIDKLAHHILTEEERRKASKIYYPVLVTPLSKLAVREVSATEFDYLSVVGSLLHLANCVRCDVAFAVGCLARYSNTPGRAHVNAVKRVVQYLYNTKTMGIRFSRNLGGEDGHKMDAVCYENAQHPDEILKIFADSDYAMDYTKKSTMGVVIMLNGGPVSWTSVIGKTVATSTCEAEINAAVSAVKDAIHLKLMLVELGLMDDAMPMKILEDNSACIAQTSQGLRHVRNAKHYEVKLRFLQQRVISNEVDFVYCPTDEQLADFVTKPLDETKFVGFRKMIMCDVPAS